MTGCALEQHGAEGARGCSTHWVDASPVAGQQHTAAQPRGIKHASPVTCKLASDAELSASAASSCCSRSAAHPHRGKRGYVNSKQGSTAEALCSYTRPCCMQSRQQSRHIAQPGGGKQASATDGGGVHCCPHPATGHALLASHNSKECGLPKALPHRRPCGWRCAPPAPHPAAAQCSPSPGAGSAAAGSR